MKYQYCYLSDAGAPLTRHIFAGKHEFWIDLLLFDNHPLVYSLVYLTVIR